MEVMTPTKPEPAQAQDREAAIRTFLIADVRGYTHFTREHGDEAAARVAAKFAEVSTEAVEAFHGELIETRGDEILAVFDSPRRALRAAVELQDAFAHELALDPSLPLRVGIGLAAGEAVPVGDGFRGNALNIASRLCGRAEAGVVLATEELVGLAGTIDGLVYEAFAPLELKGVDGAVRPLKVASARPGLPPSLPEPPGGPLPDLPPELDPASAISGREHDLRVLRWYWRRARHGHGRAVFISGDSGAGKTRLAAELARVARAESAAIVYAACAGPADQAIAQVQEAVAGSGPTLLVADDLDQAGGTLLDTVRAAVASLAGRPFLLVGTLRTDDSPLVASLLSRADHGGRGPNPARPPARRRWRRRARPPAASRSPDEALAGGGRRGLRRRRRVDRRRHGAPRRRRDPGRRRDAQRADPGRCDPGQRRPRANVERGRSAAAVRREAERALESVVRAEGAAAVIPLAGDQERHRRLLQLALVDHYGYARSVAVAARTLDPYHIGVALGVAQSAVAAYSTLERSLPGLRTPSEADFLAAQELRELAVPAALPPPPAQPPPPSPPPPPPQGAPPPPAESPPPPQHSPPPPASPSPTLPPSPATRLGSVVSAFSGAVALPSLIARVGRGELDADDAAATLSRAVVELAEARAQLALAKPPSRLHSRAALLEPWLDASLDDVLAVQTWLAVVQAGGDGEPYLAEHRAAARRARPRRSRVQEGARARPERGLTSQRSVRAAAGSATRIAAKISAQPVRPTTPSRSPSRT